MSSRGARTENGHVTSNEYTESHKIEDASVLVGKNGNHGLPDYSHTPNKVYIKEDYRGSFKALRVYDENGKSVIEIAYHPEPRLTGNRHEKVLHYHLIGDDFSRGPATLITSDLRRKYEKYLGRYGL